MFAVQQISRGERKERGEGRVRYAGPSHQVCQGPTLQGPPPMDSKIAASCYRCNFFVISVKKNVLGLLNKMTNYVNVPNIEAINKRVIGTFEGGRGTVTRGNN